MERISQALAWAHQKRIDFAAGTVLSIAAASCGGGSQPKDTANNPSIVPTAAADTFPTTPIANPTIVVHEQVAVPAECSNDLNQPFIRMVGKLPMDKELTMAIQKDPKYANLNFAPVLAVPDYSGADVSQVSILYRGYLCENWAKSAKEVADPNILLANSLMPLVVSLDEIAIWTQSPYMSDKTRIAWHEAFKAGLVTLENLDRLIQARNKPVDEKAEWRGFFDKLYGLEEFKFAKLGQVNPNARLIEGIAPATN